MSSESWFMVGIGITATLVVLYACIRKPVMLLRSKRQNDKYELDNPLDIHVEACVNELEFAQEDEIRLRVPGDGRLIAIKLTPHMKNKIIRLQGVAHSGASDLFVRLRVAEESMHPSVECKIHSVCTSEKDDSHQEIEQLMNRLLTMALGDSEKIERLIESERVKAPHLTRVDWVRAAIERWERDIR